MNMRKKALNWGTCFAILVAIALMSSTANAQNSPPKGPSYGGSVSDSKTVAPGIAWYGVLQDGFDEAKRSGKPILFVTAAPQCGGVPESRGCGDPGNRTLTGVSCPTMKSSRRRGTLSVSGRQPMKTRAKRYS